MSARRRVKKRMLKPDLTRPAPKQPTVDHNRRWPPSIIFLLRELWRENSAAQIAKILTETHAFPCTRNAVIGQIFRLRMSGKAGAIERKERL